MLQTVVRESLWAVDEEWAEAIASAKQHCDAVLRDIRDTLQMRKSDVPDLPSDELQVELDRLDREAEAAKSAAYRLLQVKIEAAKAAASTVLAAVWAEAADYVASTGDAWWTRAVALEAASAAYKEACKAAKAGDPAEYEEAVGRAARAHDAACTEAMEAYAASQREADAAYAEAHRG